MPHGDDEDKSSAKPRIKVLHGALDEHDGEIVLRGVLASDSLPLLKTDDYQREVLRPITKTKYRSPLKEAVIADKRLPDVELGMRGQNFSSYKNGVFYLEDEVYIIDGLQRISTVRDYNALNPDSPSKTQIGALIHFGTSKQQEKELFHILNANRTPMSPNVLLRNMRDEYPSLLTLYGLCHNDRDFVLYGRVSWQQSMTRGHMATALSLVRVAQFLHRHVGYKSIKRSSSGGGGNSRGSGRDLAAVLDAITNNGLGLRHLRENIKEFFEVVDECYGIRSIEYRELAVQTKANFLLALASVMSAHSNFWKGNQLHVDAELKKGLKNFPLHDPSIERFAASGAMSLIPTMVNLIIDHLNKRKRVNRLQARVKETGEA